MTSITLLLNWWVWFPTWVGIFRVLSCDQVIDMFFYNLCHYWRKDLIWIKDSPLQCNQVCTWKICNNFFPVLYSFRGVGNHSCSVSRLLYLIVMYIFLLSLPPSVLVFIYTRLLGRLLEVSFLPLVCPMRVKLLKPFYYVFKIFQLSLSYPKYPF